MPEAIKQTFVNLKADGFTFDVVLESGFANDSETMIYIQSKPPASMQVGNQHIIRLGLLKDCLETHNTSSGLDDNGVATTIFDTRSAGNGAADVVAASTVVTY